MRYWFALFLITGLAYPAFAQVAGTFSGAAASRMGGGGAIDRSPLSSRQLARLSFKLWDKKIERDEEIKQISPKTTEQQLKEKLQRILQDKGHHDAIIAEGGELMVFGPIEVC